MIKMILIALLASTSALEDLSRSLDQGFETLYKSRLAAEHILQEKGSLSSEQVKAARDNIKNANALWIGCLRVGIWESEKSKISTPVLIENIFTKCQSRRIEMSKWVKLTSKSMKFNDSDAEVEKIMAEFERINRDYANKLVSSR